jgi:NitT/TauT family transport system substrate-binding protein
MKDLNAEQGQSMFNSTIRSVIVASVLVVSSVAASAQAPVKLVLDYAIQGQQAPIVLAADGGYFKRAGVDVQVDRGYGSADSISKVASGAYDVAFADLGALVQFNGRHPDNALIDIFQVYDVAPMVMLSLKKSSITKPADFAGKRIASPPGASSRVMFPIFAATNKIDTSAIKWLDVTPQLRETMLKQGQADATTALITDVAGLKHLNISEDDISVMRFSDYGLNIYGHALLTTPAFAAKNPDVLKKIVKGLTEALKASIADPSVAIAAIKKRDPLVDDDLERHRLELVLNSAILTDHVKTAGLSAVDMDRMQKTIDVITTTFKTPAVKASSIYHSEFLPPRSDLMLP